MTRFAACADVRRLERTADCCGHEFATRRQRVEHEHKVERGLRVLCPCGDVCSEGEAPDA